MFVCVGLRTSARLISGPVLIVSSPSAEQTAGENHFRRHHCTRPTRFFWGIVTVTENRRVPTIKCWVACVRDAVLLLCAMLFAGARAHAQTCTRSIHWCAQDRIAAHKLRGNALLPGDAATRARANDANTHAHTLVFVNLCATLISQGGQTPFAAESVVLAFRDGSR